MSDSGSLATHTIVVTVARDEKNGEIFVKSDYKELPIDMLYEATKFMINQMLVSAEHINDPATRKVTSEMMRSCQYILKGGETALMEARARMQRQG